jgi:hypothetical protein
MATVARRGGKILLGAGQKFNTRARYLFYAKVNPSTEKRASKHKKENPI